MKSKFMIGAVLATAVGVGLVACSHDRPANDASNASGADSTGAGNAPSGNSRPTDDTLGTGLAPDPSDSSSGARSGNGSSGSETSHAGSGPGGP